MKTNAILLYNTLKDNLFKDHYNPRPQLKTDTSYMFNYGGRNIGKTFSWLLAIYVGWQRLDKPSVYVRRHADSIKPAKAGKLFDKVFQLYPQLNVKKYDGITYRSGTFCGYWLDGKRKEIDAPFCYTYGLSSAIELNKGSYDIQDLLLVFFDEALTADYYLTDEISRFENMISSVVRENVPAFIVMSANTVSWNAPYFRHFGIRDPRVIEKGKIEIIHGLEDTSISVEYVADGVGSEKKSLIDKRFFGLPSHTSEMITNGVWEVKPCQHWQDFHRRDSDGRYYQRKKIFSVYMKYEFEYVCIEILSHELLGLVANVRPCDDFNAEIEKGLVYRLYTDDFVTQPYERVVADSSDNIDAIVFRLYRHDRFFYADNICGEVVRRWVQYSTNGRR